MKLLRDRNEDELRELAQEVNSIGAGPEVFQVDDSGLPDLLDWGNMGLAFEMLCDLDHNPGALCLNGDGQVFRILPIGSVADSVWEALLDRLASLNPGNLT